MNISAPSLRISATSETVIPCAFDVKRGMPRVSIERVSGFLDGQSCNHSARRTYRAMRCDTARLRVHLTQNQRAVLEHLRGGIGNQASISRVRRTTQHNRQTYTLKDEGKNAVTLVASLAPQLVRKRAGSAVAMAYWVEGRVDKRFGRKGAPPEVAACPERIYFKLRSFK